MSSNQHVHPPLQRHHRRRSNPVSPSSPPAFPRRIPVRHFDVLSPIDALSATTVNSDGPSLDVSLPSPTFDLSSFSPTSAVARQSVPGQRSQKRISEDLGRPRALTPEERVRPVTSDAAADVKNGFTTGRRDGNGRAEFVLGTLPVTSASTYVDPNEGRSYETPSRAVEQTSPLAPNFTFASQGTTDRSFPNEPHPGKVNAAKRSRLNLLNPMSLLARRRSSQNQKLEDINLTINTLSVPDLPDNFDPRIRGKIVHDFSAPRTRRLYSHNDASSDTNSPSRDSLGTRGDSPASRLAPSSGVPYRSTHSPVFKEHFQDDRQPLQPDRTGYLHSMAALKISPGGEPHSANMPAFAKRLPATVPQAFLEREAKPATETLHEDESIPEEPSEPPPPPPLLPPPPPPKRTPPPPMEIPPSSGLPRHMTSTSSRFSFQIGGQASSTQEKLLEEKHKQHQATKKLTTVDAEGEEDEEVAVDDDDDYGDYNFEGDDDLEEKVPGVNADLDADEAEYLGFPSTNALQARYAAPVPMVSGSDVNGDAIPWQSLQDFHFTPQSVTFSPTSSHNASQPTPRDNEGFPIGIANSGDPSHDERVERPQKDTPIDLGQVSLFGGLGITAVKPEIPARRTHQIDRPQGQVFDDADLYFDDGEFDCDAQAEPSAEPFDEAIFDDETGKIRDIPAENARKYGAAVQAGGRDGGSVNVVDPRSANKHDTSAGLSDLQKQEQQSLAKGPPVTGLTEGNLAAYHDALALAANQAAAAGRFSRRVSFDQDSDDTSQSQLESGQPGFISDDGRFSHNFGGSSSIAEDDGFPFDDDLDDDPMIAEANAEVLENDDEGFYGQEFGFYARALGKGSSELVNGGYFASRGQNGVKRSHSGKANFQEPSLTPITERSEWSTRNSVVSLQFPGGVVPGSAQSLPSPGIAQLLELDSSGYDDDLSFSTLMKLRRGTFGGSSSSVNSLGAGHSASLPLAHHMPTHPFTLGGDYGAGRMSSSVHGLSSSVGIPESEEEEEEEEDDDDDDAERRATLTQNTPRRKVVEPPTPPTPPHDHGPTSPSGSEQRKGHHSRTSSGAESVSYARGTDGRWVLERRRTEEDGSFEVIDREYVPRGRI